jgi:hypothetical protein
VYTCDYVLFYHESLGSANLYSEAFRAHCIAILWNAIPRVEVFLLRVEEILNHRTGRLSVDYWIQPEIVVSCSCRIRQRKVGDGVGYELGGLGYALHVCRKPPFGFTKAVGRNNRL